MRCWNSPVDPLDSQNYLFSSLAFPQFFVLQKYKHVSLAFPQGLFCPSRIQIRFFSVPAGAYVSFKIPQTTYSRGGDLGGAFRPFWPKSQKGLSNIERSRHNSGDPLKVVSASAPQNLPSTCARGQGDLRSKKLPQITAGKGSWNPKLLSEDQIRSSGTAAYVLVLHVD